MRLAQRLVALLVVLGGTASAGPLTVQGTVTDVRSQWTSDGSRIVTDATVQTAAGPVVVRQLGGTVDDITMRQMPGLPVLEAGMTVTVAAHQGMDGNGRGHVVLDDVQVTDAISPDFVRTQTVGDNHPLYWESGCIFVTPDSAGTTAIANDDEFPVITASIDTWNTDVDTSTCSYMKMVEQPAKAMEVGRDEVNVIKFRDTPCADCGGNWCRPAIGDDPEQCYSSAAAGITTVAYISDKSSSRYGALVDADVEINGVNFAIAINGVTQSTATCIAELQNTMTHELGHVHGLEHTCRAPADPVRYDDNGSAVPFCTDTTDPEILNATMYNYQDCGETKKETLEDDDINAMCTVYPIAKDPHSCEPASVGSGCCSAGGDPRGSALLAAALAVFLGRRRRARPAA